MSKEYIPRPLATNSTERRKELFWLDKNEIIIEESLLFNEYLLSKLRNIDLSIYPELGNIYNELNKIFKIKEENTLLVNGADGGIRSIFLSLSGKFKIITLNPTFAMINIYPKNLLRNISSLEYEYNKDGPTIDLDLILKEINDSDQPPCVVIASPDSPTGSILSINDLKIIINTIDKKNGIFLLDATYSLFVGFQYLSELIELVSKSKSCVLTTSFSKFPGLAGARIGFLTGSSKVISKIRLVRPMYEIGALQSRILENALIEWEHCLKIIDTIKSNKNQLETLLAKYSKKILKTNGNFTLFQSNEYVESKLDSICYYRKSFNCKCLSGFSRLSTPPLKFLTQLNLILKK